MTGFSTGFSLELKVSRVCVIDNSAEGLGERCRRNHAKATRAASTPTLPRAAFLCRLMTLAIMTESDAADCGASLTASAAAAEDTTGSDRLELVSRFSRFRSARSSEAVWHRIS